MTKTAIRGAWPEKTTPPPKTKGSFKAVEVEFDYSKPIQAPGQSIYQEWIEYLLGNPPGKVAIECKTLVETRRFAHAVQRRIDSMGKKQALRVSFRQVDGAVRVWVLKKEEKK